MGSALRARGRYGASVELGAGQTLRVDTGCLVALQPSVGYDIEYVGKIKTALFGGEGLFFATLTGPGQVWLQSLPFSRMADRIYKAAPSAGGSRRGWLDTGRTRRSARRRRAMILMNALTSVLVTGANGEIGHGLLARLAAEGRSIVTLDITPLNLRWPASCAGNSPDRLSTGGFSAHPRSSKSIWSSIWPRCCRRARVHTSERSAGERRRHADLLEFAHPRGESHGRPVTFLYPSSIAMPDFPTSM